jgi:hypothetical protein
MVLVFTELLIGWTEISASASSEMVPSLFEQPMLKWYGRIIVNDGYRE